MSIPRDPSGAHEPTIPPEADVVAQPELVHGHDGPHPSTDPEGDA